MIAYEAAFAHHARTLDLIGAAELEGYGSSRAWLTAATRLPGPTVARHLRRGRFGWIRPAVQAAWDAGEISGEHVDAMAAVQRHARDDAAYDEFEPALLALARSATVSDVATIGQQWLAALHAEQEWAAALAEDERRAADAAMRAEHVADGPGETDPEPPAATDRSDESAFDDLLSDASQFGFSGPVGGFHLPYGRLASADAAMVLQALETQARRDHVEGDHRPRAERLAQALVSICEQYNSQEINAGLNTPHLVLGTAAAVYTDDALGPIRTTNGILLSRDEMRRLACRAVIWVVDHGARERLDLARSRRDFNRAQRRALEARDGHACAFPGCTISAGNCEAHHIDWWELGGRSDLDNGILLCWFHHRVVHEGRWSIERRPNGYRFWRPDRREYRDTVRRPDPLVERPKPTPRP